MHWEGCLQIPSEIYLWHDCWLRLQGDVVFVCVGRVCTCWCSAKLRARSGFAILTPSELQSGFLDLEKFLLRGQYFSWVVGFCGLPFGSSELTSANMIFSLEFVPLNLWDVPFRKLKYQESCNMGCYDRWQVLTTLASYYTPPGWDLHWALGGTLWALFQGCQVVCGQRSFISKWPAGNQDDRRWCKSGSGVCARPHCGT